MKNTQENQSKKDLSILDVKWRQKEIDHKQSKFISQNYDIPPIVADIISSRNISQIENYINPKLKNSLPNPFELQDMDVAVEHVINAINQNKKITIFADYDVDGATSSACLKRFFRLIGLEVDIYIPDRIAEGYGPNASALLKLKNEGTDLVITLDCGAVSFEPLKAAKDAGLDIIVIDHHLGALERPEAIAIVNPNMINEKFPYKNLCAAGVVFLFIVALNKSLRESGYYKKREEPNIISLLDLVALGTVCDVMSLTELSRTFVYQGLKVLKQRKNPGIRAILDLVNIDKEPGSYHLGFVIGPRINAGGRVGKSDLGARLLSTDDEIEAESLARELDLFNQQRREIEKEVLDSSIKILESGEGAYKKSDPVIFAVGEGWHPGVIGIIASRLKDLYQKPTVVIAIDKQKNVGKASCRSISGIDLGSEILQAKMEGHLTEGGGHAMAAGFSILPDKIDDLHKYFTERLGLKVEELLSNKSAEYDLSLELDQVNIELLWQLQKLEPFGVGNPKPKFIIRNLYRVNSKLVGKEQNHISCVFSAKDLVTSSRIQGMLFNGASSKLADILLNDQFKSPIDVVCNIEINSWMGIEKPQIMITDIICQS